MATPLPLASVAGVKAAKANGKVLGRQKRVFGPMALYDSGRRACRGGRIAAEPEGARYDGGRGVRMDGRFPITRESAILPTVGIR